MSRVHSRRDFLKFAPPTIAPLSLARSVAAQNPIQPGATTNPATNKPVGGAGITPGPGLAAHDAREIAVPAKG